MEQVLWILIWVAWLRIQGDFKLLDNKNQIECICKRSLWIWISTDSKLLAAWVIKLWMPSTWAHSRLWMWQLSRAVFWIRHRTFSTLTTFQMPTDPSQCQTTWCLKHKRTRTWRRIWICWCSTRCLHYPKPWTQAPGPRPWLITARDLSSPTPQSSTPP